MFRLCFIISFIFSKNLLATEAGVCLDNCLDDSSSVSSQISNMQDQIQENSNDGLYKSDEDLDQYFEDYRKDCRSEHHRAFLKEYKEYIKLAAKTFHIPYEILACKIFRESQFDPNAKSGVGALGLGQFTAETREFVTNIIGTRVLSEAHRRRYEELTEKLNKGESFRKQEGKDYEFLSARVYNRSLGNGWRAYFSELLNKPDYQNSKYAKYKTPPIFTELGAKLPPMAIVATALYTRYLLDNVMSPYKPTNEQEKVDLHLAAAGAYNMGPGNAARFMRRYAKGNSPTDAVQALGRINETKNHMESVRRCALGGVEQGPVVMQQNRAQTANKCARMR